MSNIGSSISSILSGDTVATPTISRESVALANTEQSYVLPAGTRRFTINNEGKTEARLAFAVGDTATAYLTLYPGTQYWEKGISPNVSLTLYFQTKKAGDILEIVTWA